MHHGHGYPTSTSTTSGVLTVVTADQQLQHSLYQKRTNTGHPDGNIDECVADELPIVHMQTRV